MTSHRMVSEDASELLPIIDEDYTATVTESPDSCGSPVTTIRLQAILSLRGYCPIKHRIYLVDVKATLRDVGQTLAKKINDEANSDVLYWNLANGALDSDKYERLKTSGYYPPIPCEDASELLPIIDEDYTATVTESPDSCSSPVTTIRLQAILSLRGYCPIEDRSYLSEIKAAFREAGHALAVQVNDEARQDSYYTMLANRAITQETYARQKRYLIGSPPKPQPDAEGEHRQESLSPANASPQSRPYKNAFYYDTRDSSYQTRRLYERTPGKKKKPSDPDGWRR